MTQRIRVVSGPWPTRIGAEGYVVEPTAAQAKVYPFPGLGKNEIVIHLDNDPEPFHPGPFSGPSPAERWWTCAIDRGDVEFLP
jgi:hypothetical protein